MRFRFFVITVLGLAILALGSVPGSTGTLRNSRGRVLPQAVHGTAYAALQPVGAAAGWGRVTVRDDDLPNGLHRTVQVWLFGMDPRTEYRIEIDAIEIGTILTRASGSGVLKLQSRGSGHDPVPDDLPSVDLLESTVVYGPDGPTLEGDFSSFTRPVGDTTYEKEIVLEDVTGGDASGMAKVEMEEDGHQEFKTHATGLVPGSVYSVWVDGMRIASVTADAQGQARVHLEDPDDDNPLPPEMLPVSEIVTVEWKDSAELLLLSGTFTGVGFCEHFVGTVTEITAGGFILETETGPVTVATTETTEWEDFDDHDLSVGDTVKVEGCWDDDVLIAEEVELKNRDDDENSCMKIVGIIGNVSGENFILNTDQGSLLVVTTDDTEWDDFGDHELAVGDKVKVDGCWDGDVFVAREVELKSDDEEEVCAKYVGTVTEVADDESWFTLETDTGHVTVVTNDDTEWDDFGDHKIAVGDRVKVDGCWDGDVFVALEVELKSDDEEEVCAKYVGTVTEVSDDEGWFTLETDTGHVTVVTNDDTEWDDFGDHKIAVGDRVKVDGCWDGEVFVAEEVELKKQA